MTDFEKMGIMSHRNMDIRMSPTMVNANKVRQGGHITMGIDEKTLMDIVTSPSRYYIALYVINKEQFDSLDHELTKEDKDKIGAFIKQSTLPKI